MYFVFGEMVEKAQRETETLSFSDRHELRYSFCCNHPSHKSFDNFSIVFVNFAMSCNVFICRRCLEQASDGVRSGNENKQQNPTITSLPQQHQQNELLPIVHAKVNEMPNFKVNQNSFLQQLGGAVRAVVACAAPPV